MKRLKKEKFRNTPLRTEAGNMIASQPYNPDRTPSFGDIIVAELGLLLQKGALSHKHYSYAVDLTRRIQGILTGIYWRKAHGLRQALQVVLSMTRRSIK